MFGKSKQDPDLEVFTVFDSKSQSYDAPALSPNKNVLLRDVINMLKDPQQSKNKYLTNAEDYSIFRIGTFDKKSGQLTGQTLEHIANMHDLRALAEPGALIST